MEDSNKWKVAGIIGIILLAAGAYMTYYAPTASPLATESSPLNSLVVAKSLDLSATNMTTSVGKGTLTIAPVNGYIGNETLTVTTNDPTATISVYSSIPLTLVKGGTGNATYVLPQVNSALALTFIDGFSATNGNYTVTYAIAGPVSNSTHIEASG